MVEIMWCSTSMDGNVIQSLFPVEDVVVLESRGVWQVEKGDKLLEGKAIIHRH